MKESKIRETKIPTNAPITINRIIRIVMIAL